MECNQNGEYDAAVTGLGMSLEVMPDDMKCMVVRAGAYRYAKGTTLFTGPLLSTSGRPRYLHTGVTWAFQLPSTV